MINRAVDFSAGAPNLSIIDFCEIVVGEGELPIGAVGVTGDTSNNDAACALADIAAADLAAQR